MSNAKRAHRGGSARLHGRYTTSRNAVVEDSSSDRNYQRGSWPLRTKCRILPKRQAFHHQGRRVNSGCRGPCMYAFTKSAGDIIAQWPRTLAAGASSPLVFRRNQNPQNQEGADAATRLIVWICMHPSQAVQFRSSAPLRVPEGVGGPRSACPFSYRNLRPADENREGHRCARLWIHYQSVSGFGNASATLFSASQPYSTDLR